MSIANFSVPMKSSKKQAIIVKIIHFGLIAAWPFSPKFTPNDSGKAAISSGKIFPIKLFFWA